MRIFLSLVVTLLIPCWALAQEQAPPGVPQTAESGSDPVVQMAPFLVQDFGFEMNFSASKKTRKIQKLKITSVAPGSAAAKAGLRAGDLLVSVDGIAVTSVEYTNFGGLFDRTVPIGQLTRYTFIVARGVLHKRSTITLEIKTKIPKRPNQPPEPTPPSGAAQH